MDKKLRLEIVTPERIVYSDEIASLVVRTLSGEIGILFNHAPLIGTLKPWPAKLNMLDGSTRYINCAGGFIEVKSNNITILTPAAEVPEDIDYDRAMAAKERAEKRLRLENRHDVDVSRAEAALQRAIARLATLKYDK